MNILVDYDGTKEAKEAARLAVKHAKAFNGRVILAYSMVGGPEIPRQEFERAEKELQHQEITLREAGVASETLLSVRGMETGEDIVKIAAEKNAGEIVIGIQRTSKVGDSRDASNPESRVPSPGSVHRSRYPAVNSAIVS